jgi:tetratricopeptide (TPR) repeat protein
MKKIVMMACMFAVATCAFSQKKNVSGAEGKLYEPVDLPGAKSQIELAIADPTTANQAKTYWVAGQVYFKIYEEESGKKMMKTPYDQKVMNENLIKSIDSYIKCADLDVKPNEKGKIKPKYQKEIKSRLKQYTNYLINEGIACFSEKDYESAVNVWSKYLDMPKVPLMQNEGFKADTMYNEIKFYTINAASNVPSKKQEAIKYMEELKDDNYKAETMYEWLYDAYKGIGDTEKFVNTLKEGIEKFPSNKYLMGSLINYYLESKKEAEALSYLDAAIAKDPSNPQYYLVKGELFLKQNKFAEAIEICEKAIANDANSFDAQYYTGFAYVKKAEEIEKNASEIKNQKKYLAEKKKAKADFSKAIPYLENARKIKQEDATNLNLLKTAYYRVGNGAKYKEIDALLKKLSK